jgi:hypothetical protein
MSDWISIMQGLRAVKTAQEEFLFRDFVDEYIIGPFLLDRVAEDLSRVNPLHSRMRVQLNAPAADDDEP